MAGYHITEAGPGRCTATVRPCPYGGVSGRERHFEDLKTAEMAFALEMGGTFTPVAKKTPLLSPDQPREGLGADPAKNRDLGAFDEEATEFWSSRTPEEKALLSYYKENGYVAMKALQLGGFYREGWERNFLHRFPTIEQREEVLADTALANERMAELYRAHEGVNAPRVLYRLQNAQEFSPKGDLTADEYLSSLTPGDTFSFTSWASTSADSDFTLESGEKTKEHHPERELVVFEVATKRGLPLHNPKDHRDSVQSREREVLLAPHEKYRVVGVQRNVLYRDSKTPSISESLAGVERRQGRYHVVQLEEVASDQPIAAPVQQPVPKAVSSPKVRMRKAQEELQTKSISLRLGPPSAAAKHAVEAFSQVSREIEAIRRKEDALALYNRYSAMAQGTGGSPAVAATYREITEVLSSMLGR